MDIRTILILGLIVFINGWITYYITYFKKKGEYQAIHEDIEAVTEKVETIRTKFTQETDKIKADLDFLTQQRISFSSEKKNAIINSLDKYSIWLGKLMGVSINDLSELKVNEIRRDIELAETEFQISLSRLNLMIDDVELMKLSFELRGVTAEVQNECIQALIELRGNEAQAEIYKAYHKTNFDNNEFKKYMDKRVIIFKTYLQKRNDLYKGVAEKRFAWIENLRTVLFKTLKFEGL